MSRASSLEPLAFHVVLRDFVRDREPGLFAWFASQEFGAQVVDTVRLELLRSAYRMPRDAHGAAYAAAEDAARALGVTVPVTLYQAHGHGGVNAGLWFVPTEAHLVLFGDVLDRFDGTELRALLGHELGHHLLFTMDGGSHRATCDLVERSAQRHPAFAPTAERLRRWTEIFADRAALAACGDPHVAIAVLVKAETGIREVDAAGYVEQAREVLAGVTKGSAAPTHPDLFHRALALDLVAGSAPDADRRIVAMLDGDPQIESLDLLQRAAITATTRQLLAHMLGVPWFSTEATRALAGRYFPDLRAAETGPAPDGLRWGESVAEYFAYVLLDLATTDAALEDVGVAHAAIVASATGIAEQFRRTARKELRLTAAAYDDLLRRAPVLVAAAAEQATREGAGS